MTAQETWKSDTGQKRVRHVENAVHGEVAVWCVKLGSDSSLRETLHPCSLPGHYNDLLTSEEGKKMCSREIKAIIP